MKDLLQWLIFVSVTSFQVYSSSIVPGRVCMTVEHLKTASNSTQYFECAPLADEEIKGYSLDEKYLGIWQLRDCPKEHEFDETKQKCNDKKIFRRQQATCSQNPQAADCSQPCSAPSVAPVVGAACNWLSASLQADVENSNYFLQCAPQTAGASCGEWTRIKCADSARYSEATSTCVPTTISGSCQNNQVPICNCATVASNSCPGTSECQSSVCCQPVLESTDANMIQHQAPLVCPGSYVPPLASCSQPCPEYSTCIPELGCCPVPVTNNQNKMIKIVLCPGTYTPPVMDNCDLCPSGTTCNSHINQCCPIQEPASDVVYNVLLLCPNGSPSTGSCSAGCAPNQGCYQGGCCTLNCPVGQQPTGFCNSGSSCQGQCYQGNTCCQEAIRLPTCANGQPALSRCSVQMECGTNMVCSNGGCCPAPYCPTGVQAISKCIQGSNTCGPGQSCMDGLCCPLPACPSGMLSIGVCTRTIDCGRMGFECSNGACCPLPMCPNNIVASQRCSNGCNNCCPIGQGCVNGACCQLPSCPSGNLAISTCSSSSCSNGNECVNGGCCPLPTCPGGQLATQRCRIGMGCSPGNICENGVCCPIPMCSSGSIAISICGLGNACPIGYICERRGCCQEPLPLCPNGGRASQRCNRGAECPPGYGCTPLGGCCLLSMEPVCPASTNAVCQCSPNSICPQGATCTMGTCCASTTSISVFNQVPGTSCQAPSQCNGYTNQCSQCMQNVCTCVNGAASNGASCIQMQANLLTLARNGCDQYGSPCKYLLSSARRKPIFAPVTNITDDPLFFNVATVRHCVTKTNEANFDPDSTCLPNEKCINGECKMKLWPGEYGCTTDEECTARCPNTYCEKKKSDKSVAQCQCADGFLLYGRCLSQCPKGFHESGAFCAHDDEDFFWSDGESQDSLKALLNAGQC